MNIIKHISIVKFLLNKKPHLRDDDTKLVANVWFRHLKKRGKEIFNTTANEFLQMYADGKLPNEQSIRRIRRKLQEEFPHLRGDKWYERHREQKNVKKQIYGTPELLAGGTP